MTGQRQGAAIAMTDAERDAFLRAQPVCRVAGGAPGAPRRRAGNRALTPWPGCENLLLIFENIILVGYGR